MLGLPGCKRKGRGYRRCSERCWGRRGQGAFVEARLLESLRAFACSGTRRNRGSKGGLLLVWAGIEGQPLPGDETSCERPNGKSARPGIASEEERNAPEWGLPLDHAVQILSTGAANKKIGHSSLRIGKGGPHIAAEPGNRLRGCSPFKASPSRNGK